MKLGHMRNLDLKLLQLLATLLVERNVTRTAERMNMTQSAVSHALAKLRRAFQDPLFVQTREGMMPTSRTLQLADPLGAALANMREALAPRAPFEPARCDQTFRVATTDYVSYLLLPALLDRLREVAPKVRLQISALHPEPDWLRLGDGSLDLAMAYLRRVPGDFHSRSLFRDRYCLVARAGHPAVGERVTLARYLELEHIVMTPFLTGLVDERLDQEGKHRKVAVAIPQFLLIPELVARTDLVATMGERVARDFAQRLALRVLPLPLDLGLITVRLAWHPRSHAEPQHQWLRTLIAEVAQSVIPQAAPAS
jgi:DNA-binding transcriptional LysR family regulator